MLWFVRCSRRPPEAELVLVCVVKDQLAMVARNGELLETEGARLQQLREVSDLCLQLRGVCFHASSNAAQELRDPLLHLSYSAALAAEPVEESLCHHRIFLLILFYDFTMDYIYGIDRLKVAVPLGILAERSRELSLQIGLKDQAQFKLDPFTRT
jgi:hypothetical protein